MNTILFVFFIMSYPLTAYTDLIDRPITPRSRPTFVPKPRRVIIDPSSKGRVYLNTTTSPSAFYIPSKSATPIIQPDNKPDQINLDFSSSDRRASQDLDLLMRHIVLRRNEINIDDLLSQLYHGDIEAFENEAPVFYQLIRNRFETKTNTITSSCTTTPTSSFSVISTNTSGMVTPEGD